MLAYDENSKKSTSKRSCRDVKDNTLFIPVREKCQPLQLLVTREVTFLQVPVIYMYEDVWGFIYGVLQCNFRIPSCPETLLFFILTQAFLSSFNVIDGIISSLSCTILQLELGCCENSSYTIFCNNIGHAGENIGYLFSRVMTTLHDLPHGTLSTSSRSSIHHWPLCTLDGFGQYTSCTL